MLKWEIITQWFWDFFSLLRWADILDVLLIAVLVYRVLVLMKGTRAGQVLIGMALIGVIYWTAVWSEMRTVAAALNYVFENIVIILVILFQQDIRRVLSQVGRASIFKSQDSLHESQMLEELVKSCISMSNKKIGALMVLEKQADVLDFVEPGTIIDSHISKEMLTSIFLPVSPLHDGAVLLRKGRIYMAGCFLPLTLNPSVSKSVGTRHRAAVGLTEETDALCIVVSEENGSVSLAAGGRITHNLDAAQLRKMLLELV